jgi:hypothetical protein
VNLKLSIGSSTVGLAEVNGVTSYFSVFLYLIIN